MERDREHMSRHVRRRTRQKRPGHGTMRLRHSEYVNPEEIAAHMMSDPDFAEIPEELQNEEIKDLPTNLSKKLSIKWVVVSTGGVFLVSTSNFLQIYFVSIS